MLKRLILGLFAIGCFAQTTPPNITTGSNPPAIGTCGDIVNVGNLYVRSQNPANAPIGVFRCTQIGPSERGSGAYSWQPIGYLAVDVLPNTCTIGDIAFRTSGVPSGQNLYGCALTNTWVPLGGINGAGYANGTYCVNVATGVATLTQNGCPGGGGGGGVTWTSLTNPQWAGLTNTQWTTMGN